MSCNMILTFSFIQNNYMNRNKYIANCLIANWPIKHTLKIMQKNASIRLKRVLIPIITINFDSPEKLTQSM